VPPTTDTSRATIPSGRELLTVTSSLAG
jgi:hypothetical protein